eukprot:g67454.t1
MRRAVEWGKDIQRVTSMTIDMTKPFHLPCLHQTRLGAADEVAECGMAEPEESESESSDEDAPLVAPSLVRGSMVSAMKNGTQLV